MEDARLALTRERIIHAAVHVIERDGLEAATMRRVAAELGVGVMSLYHYVGGKQDLLDGVAEWLVDRIDLPAADEGETAVRTLILSFRSVARDYPRSVNLLLTRELHSGPGLLLADRAIGMARAAGFDAETSLQVVSVFLSYAIGSLMREAGMARFFAHIGHEDLSAGIATLAPGTYPNLTALDPGALKYNPEADFEFGLRLLLKAVAGLPRETRG